MDADLRGLLTGQPDVDRGGTAASAAAGGRPRRGGDALVLDGEGEPMDGLRALCAAAWTAAGEGKCALDGEKALARLGL